MLQGDRGLRRGRRSRRWPTVATMFSSPVLLVALLAAPAAAFNVASPTATLTGSALCTRALVYARAPAPEAMARAAPARSAIIEMHHSAFFPHLHKRDRISVSNRAGRKPSKKARKPTSDPTDGTSKIPGLTKLAPFKAYLLLAALVWAVVGSVSN